MTKMLKIAYLFVALSFIVGSAAMADDKDQLRDRKRDGSCDNDAILADVVPTLSKG